MKNSVLGLHPGACLAGIRHENELSDPWVTPLLGHSIRCWVALVRPVAHFGVFHGVILMFDGDRPAQHKNGYFFLPAPSPLGNPHVT